MYICLMKFRPALKVIFFPFLFLLTAKGIGQNSIDDLRFLLPDSVNGYWENYQKDPEKNTFSLIDFIEKIRTVNPKLDYGCLADSLLPSLAKNEENPYYQAYANYLLGTYSMSFNHSAGTPDYLNKAKEAANRMKDNSYSRILKIKIELAIGAYFFHLGNLNQALHANEEAKKINRQLGDSVFDAYINNNSAVIYKGLGENRKAIELFKKNCHPNTFSEDLYPLSLTNIADSYLNMEMPDSAIRYIRKALEVTPSFPRNYSLANTYYLLGKVYAMNKKMDSAVFFFLKGIEIAERNRDENSRMQILVDLSSLYAEFGRYSQAMECADLLASLARQNNNLMAYTIALKEKSLILGMTGRKEEAYETLKEYTILSDSINAHENADKAKQNLLEKEFYLEQQKIEYAYREHQLKLKNRIDRQRWMTVSALLLFALGFCIVLIHIKKKNNELKNKSLLEKALLENLEIKKKELTNSIMFRMNKDELIKKIIQGLQDLSLSLDEKSKKKVSALIRSLQYSLDQDLLSEFEISFAQIHEKFYQKLLQDFPSLSLSEKRLCAFVRLNLTTKEIATITNLDPNSIRVAKVRLRKKLNLTNSSQSLYDFLSLY